MMTFKEAEQTFKKAYPKRTIMSAADVDQNRYIVVAQEDTSKADYADPTFFIYKNNGRVEQTNCEDEFDLIEDAFEHRKIK